MSDLVLSIAPELRDRLGALAEKLGKSVDDCLVLAVQEFVATWEDYTLTVEALDGDEEERPVLRAVND